MVKMLDDQILTYLSVKKPTVLNGPYTISNGLLNIICLGSGWTNRKW